MIEVVILIVNFITLLLVMGIGEKVLDIEDYLFFRELMDSESDIRDSREL